MDFRERNRKHFKNDILEGATPDCRDDGIQRKTKISFCQYASFGLPVHHWHDVPEISPEIARSTFHFLSPSTSTPMSRDNRCLYYFTKGTFFFLLLVAGSTGTICRRRPSAEDVTLLVRLFIYLCSPAHAKQAKRPYLFLVFTLRLWREEARSFFPFSLRENVQRRD